MKKMLLATAAAVIVLVGITSAMTWAGKIKKEIVGLTPEQVVGSRPLTTRMGGNGRSCSAIPAKAGGGLIGSGYPAACVSLHIRIRKTNWLRSSKGLGIWAREKDSTQLS